MKYLIILASTALILSLGCSENQEVDPSATTINPQASASEKSSIDKGKEHQLVVQAPTPGVSRSKDQQPLNARYTLTAKNAGKLLIRVRDPLLVKDPPPWANTMGSLESDGLAQRVLELNSEDIGIPLAIEARVVHLFEPEEIVRVEFTMYRGNKAENWFNFYQCQPAMKTVRSNWKGSFNTDGDPVVINSGEAAPLWLFRFGGEGDKTPAKVPLDRVGMQNMLIELGWKSKLNTLKP